MKLLLTSAGFTNGTIVNALRELVGENLKDKNLAFIPTAASLEMGDKRWLINDLINCEKIGFKEINILEISAIPKILLRQRLEHADVLLFGGGSTSHLLFWLKKSGVEQMLPNLLENRIYVGISAGSMVATKSLALSNQFKKEFAKKIGECVGEEGLGYVNFHIRPHLNSKDFPHASMEKIAKIAERLKEPIYAIDDNTAVKVDGNLVTIVSEGKWKKFN